MRKTSSSLNFLPKMSHFTQLSVISGKIEKLEILLVETLDKFNVCLQEPKSKHQVLQQYSKIYVQ